MHLVGHFFVRWFTAWTDPPMEESLLVGGAYGIKVCWLALWAGAPSEAAARCVDWWAPGRRRKEFT